jgi:hypothetical protein
MKRFAPALLWFGWGSAMVAGCGGRTGALDELYGDEGGAAMSGSSSGGTRAGTAGRGGTSNVAGTRPVGGAAPVAGAGGVTTGGFGGTVVGGTFGFGGTVVGGMPSGGVGGFAGFPGGGVGPVGGTGSLDCQTCLTQACTPQLAQCFQDFGCIAIFGCVVNTGCNTLECYSPMFCKDIIDQFGGPAGGSMSQVLDVVGCALNSGCQCQ